MSNPLIEAINNENTEKVRELLANPNIDVNVKDMGYPALIVALGKRSIDIVKLLLAHPNINVNFEDEYGNIALIKAVYDGNIEAIKELLKHPNIVVNAKDINEDTALSNAIRYGNIEIIKELLKHPKIDVNAKDRLGDTALMSAIQGQNIEIIKELLKHPKIDINYRNRRSHLTAKGWVESIIKRRPGAGFEEILEILEILEPLEDPNEALDSRGVTKLMMASIQETRRLLQHPKIDTNIQDNLGRSALSRATEDGNLEKIELLLSNQKTNVNIISRYDNGAPAFHMLANYIITQPLHREINYITNIIHAYKKIQDFEIDAVDNHGNTVLMRIVFFFISRKQAIQEIRYQNKLLELVELFIKEEVNPTIPNHNGRTILDLSTFLPNNVKDGIQTLYDTYLSKQ